jgi:glycosyltransferase involved in cell wall biosynthesis
VRLQFAVAEMAVGGAERMVIEMVRDACGRGDSTALLAAPGPFDDELSGLALDRVSLPRGRHPGALARAAVISTRFTRRFGPDLIHAHNVRVTAVARCASQLSKRSGRPPLLTTFHGVPDAEVPAAARILCLADLVVCVSEDLRGRLRAEGLPDEKLSVIQNGVPDAEALSAERRTEIDAELGLGDDSAVVSIVGRLAPQKAHDRFLRAAAVVHRLRPEVRFLIVGDGELRPGLETLAANLGLGEQVTFAGLRSDATDLIARSDLLVFSSVWEGLSIAALEALARGVPVISTDVAGARELLATGSGMIVAQDDGALADAIVRALADPDLRQRMGREGRRLHADRFSVDRMIAAYRSAYETLRAA